MSPVIRTGAPWRARMSIVATIAALATVFAVIAPQSAHATTAPTYAQMMQRVVDDTNAVRAGAGLRPLVRNADMDRVAADWARQQWQNGTMSHNPSYSTQIPSGWQRAGENVAKGYTYLQVVPAWKASPGHYANIVNDYTSIGIGYFEQDGRRYWCQLFAKYPGVTQPAIAPATMPAHIPAPTTVRTASPRTTGTGAPTVTMTTAASVAGPTAPAGTPVTLSAPSFESGLGSWTSAAGRVQGPNLNARSGVYSLLVAGGPGRTTSQNVSATVAAGSIHTFTVWVHADGVAPGVARLRTVGGASTEAAEVTFTATSSAWTRVSVNLTAKSAHTGFRLDVLTPGSGRSYRLDAVSLVRTGGPGAGAPASLPVSPGSIPAPSTGAPFVVTLDGPRSAPAE